MKTKLIAVIIIGVIISAGVGYLYAFSPNQKPIDYREQGMYDLHKSIIEEIYPAIKGEYESGQINKTSYIAKLKNLEKNEQGILDEVIKEEFDDPKIKDYFYGSPLKNESIISIELKRLLGK